MGSLPNCLYGVREGEDDRSQPSISDIDSPVFHWFDLPISEVRLANCFVPGSLPRLARGLFGNKSLSPMRIDVGGCSVRFSGSLTVVTKTAIPLLPETDRRLSQIVRYTYECGAEHCIQGL